MRGINAADAGPATSPDRPVFVGAACLPPAAPFNLRAATLGNAVTFDWDLESVAEPLVTAPPTRSVPVATVIEAGSRPGAADLAVLPMTTNAFKTVWGPPGTYWTRVKTSNACGMTAVSEDVPVTLDAACVVPQRPSSWDIVGPVQGEPNVAVGLTFVPPGGAVFEGFRLEVGTAPGLANVRTETLNLRYQASAGLHGSGVSNLPPGTYYSRVRALNVCGAGPASPEGRFVVGSSCAQLRAPGSLVVDVDGTTVSMRWPTGDSELSQVFPGSILEIGTAEGATDVGVVNGPFGGDYQYKTYATTLPAGNYVARVRLTTACSTSNPSIEVPFTVQ